MQANIKKLRQILAEKSLGGFIVTNPSNILYLTGFCGISPTEREAILIITQDYTTLITARLYQQEARKLATNSLKVKIAPERNKIDKFIKESLKSAKTVGFEENDLKYGEFIKYKKLLAGPSVILNPSNSFRINSKNNLNIDPSVASLHQDDIPGRTKLIPTKKLVENLRIIKTADELNKIEKAQLISQKAFNQVLKTLKIGQTELEIAHTLKSIIHSLGAEALAFESIIASGPNSGKPHHVTSNRRLAKSDTLLLDFGAKYQNYCADFSRTVVIGEASDKQRNIFNHVLNAQKEAVAKIVVGLKTHEAYHAANKVFKKHKLEKYFTHGLGHGIGLQVHEPPYLRPTPRSPEQRRMSALGSTINDQLLINQMVFSIEPGLYFDWGGVRIEDLVVIKDGRVKVLGETAQSLIQIPTP